MDKQSKIQNRLSPNGGKSKIQNDVEGRFRRTLAGIGRALTVPPVPAPPVVPPSMTGATAEQRELWQLRQDVNGLRKHQELLTRYLVRGVLAVLSVGAPAFGFSFINQFLKALGLLK